MAAVVRGAVVLELAAGDVPAARRVLEDLRRAGPRGLAAGEVALHTDGRATYALDARWLEVARVLQAVGLATCVSVTTSLAFGWDCYSALGTGASLGVSWSVALIVRDRRRLHREVRSLLGALPDLVRARRVQTH